MDRGTLCFGFAAAQNLVVSDMRSADCWEDPNAFFWRGTGNAEAFWGMDWLILILCVGERSGGTGNRGDFASAALHFFLRQICWQTGLEVQA